MAKPTLSFTDNEISEANERLPRFTLPLSERPARSQGKGSDEFNRVREPDL